MILFATFSHGHIFLFCAVSTACCNSFFVFFHSGKRVRMQVNRLRIASPRGWEPGQDHLDLEEGRWTLVSASAALGNRPPAIVTRSSLPTGPFQWSLGLSTRKRPPVILNGLTKQGAAILIINVQWLPLLSPPKLSFSPLARWYFTFF